MHGKGILFVPKDKYIYYGYFQRDEKHGFGREFYDEKAIINRTEKDSNQFYIN
jgi:hypothetical protein